MTMTTEKTNFLGIPIEGEIHKGDKRAPQRPLDEFAPIVQAVLDEPSVTEFGWRQYTPYFNDGDPCVFSANGVWVRTTDSRPGESTDSLEVEWGSNHGLGRREKHWDAGRRRWELRGYEGPDEARYDRCMALAKAVDSGEFDDVLLDAFGDHSEITITRTGIRVETYEHD